MRIAIVNDLAMAVESLRRVICSSGLHHLAWVARTGADAVEMCKDDVPDLILMDMVMPGMNGVQATRKIMRECPCPILIVTSSVTSHASMVFEAMGAGALDAVVTPVLAGETKTASAETLLNKIAMIGKLRGPAVSSVYPTRAIARPAAAADADIPQLVAIGCSTGGPRAVVTLLNSFPPHFNAAVVIIQHMDKKFVAGFADWLHQQSPLPVMVPEDGTAVRPGRVYLPGTRDHVRINGAGELIYSKTTEECFYHPSVDIFFNSIAETYQQRCIGVLLTGMGRDGGAGLLALRRRGYLTIAQDKQSSVVYGMPRYASELEAAVKILPIEKIGSEIVQGMTTLLQKFAGLSE